MKKSDVIVAASIAASFLAIGAILGASITDMRHREMLIKYGVAEYNPFNADFEILDGRCIDRVQYNLVEDSSFIGAPPSDSDENQ